MYLNNPAKVVIGKLGVVLSIGELRHSLEGDNS